MDQLWGSGCNRFLCVYGTCFQLGTDLVGTNHPDFWGSFDYLFRHAPLDGNLPSDKEEKMISQVVKVVLGLVICVILPIKIVINAIRELIIVTKRP